jgi:hypothetical protein
MAPEPASTPAAAPPITPTTPPPAAPVVVAPPAPPSTVGDAPPSDAAPIDSAALSIAVAAAAVTMMGGDKPGPYDAVTGIVGATLIATLLGYERPRRRTMSQSIAFSFTFGVAAILAGGCLRDLVGHGGFFGLQEALEAVWSPDGYRSPRYLDVFMTPIYEPVVWLVTTGLVLVLDRVRPRWWVRPTGPGSSTVAR